jgi:hypothetical protein
MARAAPAAVTTNPAHSKAAFSGNTVLLSKSNRRHAPNSRNAARITGISEETRSDNFCLLAVGFRPMALMAQKTPTEIQMASIQE